MQGAKTPSTTMTALAYDASTPDRVFLAEQEKVGTTPGGGTFRVTASSDGGATWTQLGDTLPGRVNGLALGVDGRYLFAGTEAGALRFTLG